MTERHIAEIAVVGAGVVGMAIALRLAADGRRVTLVDPEAAGSGASSGNAGIIADYAVLPVGTPAVLRALPQFLLSRTSPFSIRHAALLSLAPWLWRFAVQSLPGPARRNAAAIAALTASAAAGWQDLAAEVQGAALIRRRGCLYMYETARVFRAAQADLDLRRALGVSVELIEAGALATLEPGLTAVEGGGAFFPDALSLSDPAAMMVLMAARLATAGVQHLRLRADALERGVDGVQITGPDLRLHARTVVIAAGAWSRGLAVQAGDRVPLDTERGYHAEWDMARPRLSRPVSPTERGFYLCPMTGRLRAAGTVELGGLDAPASAHRINRLVEGVQALFPDLGPPDRTWMGHRPSMPDSLPVIGPSRGGANVIHAFGHGHLGLTLAPVTAQIVSDVVAGRAPGVEIAPYSAGRF